jgi:Icc protein
VKNAIRIAQVSDCHLPATPGQTYRGIDPRKNLATLLKKVKSFRPDLLLLTGDLSEDGSRAAYHDLKKYLSPLGVPLLALPGNHDEAGRLNEYFPGSPAGTISVSEHGAWRIVRLNTCVPGRPEGRLSENALEELEVLLNSDENHPCIIALHHQPVEIGSPWIDKYPLLDPQKLLRIIDAQASVKAVLWGHIHQAFAAERNGVAMLGGPSSAINAAPGAQKFTADGKGPAFRWLKLGSDMTFTSGIG